MAPQQKNAPESGRWSILRGKLDLGERAGNSLRDPAHALQGDALRHVMWCMDDRRRAPVAPHDRDALASRTGQHDPVYQHGQPARPPGAECRGHPLDGGSGAMYHSDREAAVVDTIEVDDACVAEQVGPLPHEGPRPEQAVFLGVREEHAHSRVRRQGVQRGKHGHHARRVVDRARRAVGHTVGREQQGAGDTGGAGEQIRHTRVERTDQRAHHQREQLERAERRERGGREARRHGEGLAFRVVMRREPYRDASPRADTDQVDSLERRPPEAMQQRSPREPVLHRHESARPELAFQHVPDLQVRCRAAEPRDRDGGEQRPVVRHAATSLATRSRSEAATGASGGRTGPPYNPPPTASIAAFTPAGPSFPTTSRSSGASRSWSLPAPSRSPARKAANTWAQSAAAKHATARMPPSQPSSRAAYRSEPEPTKTDHSGAASRYAARFFASPDESLAPTMLVCAASWRSRPAAIGRCVYLGML